MVVKKHFYLTRLTALKSHKKWMLIANGEDEISVFCYYSYSFKHLLPFKKSSCNRLPSVGSETMAIDSQSNLAIWFGLRDTVLCRKIA